MPQKILVVEDEEELAASFKDILSAHGYGVTIATDGFDALEKVIGGEYDLITMDLKMPRFGGLRATELIRLRHNVSTPIVVISAYISQAEEKLRKLAVHHFLEKPVDATTLVDMVKEALGDASDSLDISARGAG